MKSNQVLVIAGGCFDYSDNCLSSVEVVDLNSNNQGERCSIPDLPYPVRAMRLGLVNSTMFFCGGADPKCSRYNQPF